MLRKTHKNSLEGNQLEKERINRAVGICNMLADKSFLYLVRF